MIRDILEKNEDLKKFLFIRGFFMTNREGVNPDVFPFYGQWNRINLQGYDVYTHPLTRVNYFEKDGKVSFLFGHAYNPFTGEVDETKILERIHDSIGTKDYYDRVDEITGIFVLGYIHEDGVRFVVDPSGMQSACYCVDEKNFSISSHPQLIADISGYSMDSFVKELVEYKWYSRVMGPYLPADMTPFEKVKRIVPNIAFTYSKKEKDVQCKRFYPIKDLKECQSEDEYKEIIESAADILKKNMELVLKKWNNPWLSLTGGIDSNTTYAAANGYYEKINTFSYCSAEKETIDCDAAEIIAKRFSSPWIKYFIPTENEGIDRFEEKKAIIFHNNGYVARTKDNELRKRFYLQENCSAEIEIKSWTSETIRAYWYKHYGRKKMPKLSAKLYRNLYKIFTTNRKLAHKIDRIFEEYIQKFEYDKIPSQYPSADMHYNEVTWGSWGGLNISEMKYCFDITIIYNNRRFLDLLFKVPLKDRISDKHHLDMKKLLNKDLYDMGIRVVNMKETKFRAFALNVLFTINNILPF